MLGVCSLDFICWLCFRVSKKGLVTIKQSLVLCWSDDGENSLGWNVEICHLFRCVNCTDPDLSQGLKKQKFKRQKSLSFGNYHARNKMPTYVWFLLNCKFCSHNTLKSIGWEEKINQIKAEMNLIHNMMEFSLCWIHICAAIWKLIYVVVQLMDSLMFGLNPFVFRLFAYLCCARQYSALSRWNSIEMRTIQSNCNKSNKINNHYFVIFGSGRKLLRLKHIIIHKQSTSN